MTMFVPSTTRTCVNPSLDIHETGDSAFRPRSLPCDAYRRPEQR